MSHTRPRRHKRALTALGVATITIVAGLVGAPAASASTIVTCAGPVSGSASVAVGNTLEFNVGGQCDALTVALSAFGMGTFTVNGQPLSLTNSLVATGDTVIFSPTTAGSTSLGFSDTNNPFGNFDAFTITITAGGSSDDTATTEPVAAPATMSLALGDNATCDGGSPTGMTGEWMTLPGSGDCHNTATPTATLLGWSTSADFPVAIAQRQSANNWGAYELTDANGVVTAIYIPAGWATFVTGSTNLYPIWNK